ncbi:MAG: hypothetical protein J0H18_10515 [Rhizobiales bacterium]|nr:hypothetical protein [Hyphomicrobiales bacterium]
MATIHYRYCSRQTPTITTESLRDAIVRIMDAQLEDGRRIRQSIRARKQKCLDEHDVVLNAYSQTNDWVFAEFLRAEPGAFLITVEDDRNDERLIVKQHPAPEGNAPHRGSLYALIHGDHVLFASKGYFSSRCLEDYLTWFCQKDALLLANDRRIVLAARTAVSEKMRASSVRFRFDPLEAANVRPAGRDDLHHEAERRPTPQGLLNTLLIADADLRRLVEGGQVEVDVLLKFKNGRRSRDLNIGDLHRVFRNVEDVEDLSFEGPDGPVNGLGARLQGKTSIQPIGSLFDANDARRKLIQQFDDWRAEGHI